MKRFAIAFGAAAVLPFSALAAPYTSSSMAATAGPSYNYVQGDYLANGNLHGLDRDYDGYGVEASFALLPNIFVNGRVDRVITDGSGRNINRGSIGVGINDFFDYGGPSGTGLGYYGSVSYERLGLHDLRGGDDATGTGFGINAGLRWMVDPAIELNPSIGFVDYSSISGDGLDRGSPNGWRYGMRGVAHVNDAIAVSAEYAKADYDKGGADIEFANEVRVGARLMF